MMICTGQDRRRTTAAVQQQMAWQQLTGWLSTVIFLPSWLQSTSYKASMAMLGCMEGAGESQVVLVVGCQTGQNTRHTYLDGFILIIPIKLGPATIQRFKDKQGGTG
jgi:hypothetical protein